MLDNLMSEQQVQKLLDKRQRRDVRLLIRTVMSTPLKDGPVTEVDGKISIAELSKKNLDVQTRIILTMAGQAAGGDPKSAEFLFKYAGYTPPTEQNVTVNLPRIINDLEFKEEQMLEEAADLMLAEGEEVKEDVITTDSETV